MAEETQEQVVPNTRDLIRIVDDDPTICESFCYLMTAEGWAASSYSSAEEFLQKDDRLRPGCLVLDVQLDGMSGLTLQQELTEMSSDLPIIFVSAYGSIEMAVGAVLRGACDFIPKPVDENKLLAAVGRAVAKCRLLRHEKMQLRASAENWESLTPREKDVAKLIAQGLPNKLVADRLSVSINTIQVHRAKIYHKLGCKSAAEITSLLHLLS